MPDDNTQNRKVTWSIVFAFMMAEAIALTLVLGLFWYFTQGATSNADDVRTVLNAQAAAWNRGDLEGYMTGYWQSEELQFYSGGDVTKGWQPTLDRYRKQYQGEGKAMGHLTFADVNVEFIANDAALACGHWKLDMPDGKIHQGLFSLIVRRFGSDWRVVHDHTSVKPP